MQASYPLPAGTYIYTASARLDGSFHTGCQGLDKFHSFLFVYIKKAENDYFHEWPFSLLKKVY